MKRSLHVPSLYEAMSHVKAKILQIWMLRLHRLACNSSLKPSSSSCQNLLCCI